MNSAERKIPSIATLRAFERVARLGSVTRAAAELHTSQSAISRQLRQLETDLGIALVSANGRGIMLTPAGQAYSQHVSAALAALTRAGEIASANEHELTIACTHEVSHLLLMPSYSALKKALGRNAHIRILTCEYSTIPVMIDAGADVIFEYHRTAPKQPSVVVVPEEIVPAASPALAAAEELKLGREPGHWSEIPRLSLTKENSGWATWDDWFEAQGIKAPEARQYQFDNYVYALEAATHGEGLVLAWRGFADRYIETGQLVTLRPTWHHSGSSLYAKLTPNGASKRLARKCISFLATRTMFTGGL
jgi:LysR family glycine cleavage system transcriptional activator